MAQYLGFRWVDSRCSVDGSAHPPRDPRNGLMGPTRRSGSLGRDFVSCQVVSDGQKRRPLDPSSSCFSDAWLLGFVLNQCAFGVGQVRSLRDPLVLRDLAWRRTTCRQGRCKSDLSRRIASRLATGAGCYTNSSSRMPLRLRWCHRRPHFAQDHGARTPQNAGNTPPRQRFGRVTPRQVERYHVQYARTQSEPTYSPACSSRPAQRPVVPAHRRSAQSAFATGRTNPERVRSGLRHGGQFEPQHVAATEPCSFCAFGGVDL